MLKGAPAAGEPPQNGCEAEGGTWEYSSGSVVLKTRRHQGSLAHKGYLGLRAFLEVNVPLQSPNREGNFHGQVSFAVSEDDEMGLNGSHKSLKFISTQYFHMG